MKKIGTAAGLAAMTIVVGVLSGAALANGTHGTAKSESASAPAAKVYICHATGSASNPYVLIHVSSHALPAHAGHQSGHDIVLGSSPGACPQPATTASVKAAEHTQAAPPVKSAEQPDNATAPKANEREQNETAEASEQGEASDQNESASEQQLKSDDDNGRGDDNSGDREQHASDQSDD